MGYSLHVPLGFGRPKIKPAAAAREGRQGRRVAVRFRVRRLGALVEKRRVGRQRFN
jgi:hypothetical protein